MKNVKVKILTAAMLLGGATLFSGTTTASPLESGDNPGALCETYWGSQAANVKGYYGSLNVSAKSWLVCDLPVAAADGAADVVDNLYIETSTPLTAVNYRCFVGSQTIAAAGAPMARTIEWSESVAQTDANGLLEVPALSTHADTLEADTLIAACQLDSGHRLAAVILP